MANYREILRLHHSLGLNETEIAAICQCARNTVAETLQRLLGKNQCHHALKRKSSEIMQEGWARDAASVTDTDTGQIFPAYVFVRP